MKCAKYTSILKYLIILSFLRKRLVLGCGGGFGAIDGRLMTNPTLTWTMNPPVTWTYPDANALGQQSFLPGQSLAQTQAQNAANGDITAAVLQALTAVGLPTAGMTIRPTYSPPVINDCIKVGSGNQAETAIGDSFGIVEQGAVVFLATTSAAIKIATCAARSFDATVTRAPFIQSASVSIDGLTASGFQMDQVAAQMMVQLNFNDNVKFVTEITVTQ